MNDITVVKRDGGLGDGYKYNLTQQITEFQQDAVVDLNSGTATNPAKDNTMQFDGCGNRTNLNGVPEAYNNMNQPNDVAHDNDGNVQSRAGVTYTYDAQNRLREAASAVATIDFYYDGLNRQVARVISGAVPPGSTPTPSPSPIVVPTISPLPSASPLPSVGSTPTVPPIYTPTVPPINTPTPSLPPGVLQQCAPVSYTNVSAFRVQMNTATSGATIFYTTDGTTPTHNGSTPTGTTQVYQAPVPVGPCGEKFFEAIAYKLGMSDSDVTTYDARFTNGCSGGGGTASSVIVFSVWDGDWAILEEYNASGTRVQGYVQGYHGLVKTTVDNIYYYQDELGSTSHVANASGTLIEYYKYDLYGKPTYFNSNGVQLSTSAYSVADLGNGGARWIPQLGLYDDRNRFMSPDLGRFLQPDPIGFKGDASNLYRYVGNDWANRTDPAGLGEESIERRRENAQDTTKDGPHHDFQERLSAWEVEHQASIDAHHSENVRSARAEARDGAFVAEMNRLIGVSPKFAQNGRGDPQQPGGVPAGFVPATDRTGHVVNYTSTQKGFRWQLVDSKGQPFKGGDLKNKETLLNTNAPGDVRTSGEKRISTGGIMTDVVGPIKAYGPQTNRRIESTFSNTVIWDGHPYPISTRFRQEIVIEHGVPTSITETAY